MQLFSRKSEKKRNFLPKSFAGTEKSRTFASQSRNNEITSKQRNPVISILQASHLRCYDAAKGGGEK